VTSGSMSSGTSQRVEPFDWAQGRVARLSRQIVGIAPKNDFVERPLCALPPARGGYQIHKRSLLERLFYSVCGWSKLLVPKVTGGLCPHRGVKPLRGSSTALVPRSVAALRVSATPPNCQM